MDIDFVVMWVDGNDPEWLAEKQKYSPKKITDANSANRFRDWNLMKYWFRGVEKFAPWVHKVYFITWGHLPSFLNPDAPKLEIVKHTDFIPAEYLPTFNSTVIETNLFRIPSLAERYVLFNDDTFLLKPVPAERFFKNGLPCAYFAELPLTPTKGLGVFQKHIVNDLTLINEHFPKKEAYRKNRSKYYSGRYSLKDRFRTLCMEYLSPNFFSDFKNYHAPNALLKSVLQEIWEVEPSVLDTSGKQRFRTELNVNQYISLYWQLASGRFEPCSVNNCLYEISGENIDSICDSVRSQTSEMICLNDNEAELDCDGLTAQLQKAFETILPEKCSFEK